MFGIVPLFGLAIAGVTIGGLDNLLAPWPLSIVLGLFAGKEIGVFSAVWLADRTRVASKSAHLTRDHVYTMALVCGIRFTLSLFVGALAFQDRALVDAAKLGTLAGSALSVVATFVILRLARPRSKNEIDRDEAEEVLEELSNGAQLRSGPCAKRLRAPAD